MKIVDNLEKWTVETGRRAHHNTTKSRSSDKNSQNLIAYGWVLKSKSNERPWQKNLGTCRRPMAMQTQQDWPGDPPTHFDTNKFTSVFQGIVNTYGIHVIRKRILRFSRLSCFLFFWRDVRGHRTRDGPALSFDLLHSQREGLGKPGALGDMAGMAFGGRYMLLLMSIRRSIWVSSTTTCSR